MKVNLVIPDTGKDVWIAAALLSGTMRLEFDFMTFCSLSGCKPNRHTRRALREMVKAGYLERGKRLRRDGKWPFVYTSRSPLDFPGGEE